MQGNITDMESGFQMAKNYLKAAYEGAREAKESVAAAPEKQKKPGL
jgi:hypothetical protein